MALLDNIMQQVTPVVVLGSANPSGLISTGGSVATAPRQYTTVTNTIVTADGTAVTIAAGQKAFLQNWDDAAVYVRCGAGASASNASFLLKAGTAANDGNGGSVLIDDFVGIVSILAATGAPRVNVALYA